jgi:hypothetical protein
MSRTSDTRVHRSQPNSFSSIKGRSLSSLRAAERTKERLYADFTVANKVSEVEEETCPSPTASIFSRGYRFPLLLRFSGA